MSQTSPHTHLTDEDLLQAYRKNADNTWLGILLQRYTLLLLGVALKYLKDRDAAQDAVQQVFLKAITHLPQGEIQNFKGWLYILMRNHCLQLLRDKTHIAGDDALEHIADAQDAQADLLLHEYTLVQLTVALGELMAEQRQCITLFYLQKKSYQQISGATGFNFAQVKSYIQNGKRNLRIAIERKLAKRPQ